MRKKNSYASRPVKSASLCKGLLEAWPFLGKSESTFMARRKESGLDFLASLPWPLSLVLGVLAFVAVRYGGLVFANSQNPILAAFGKALANGALSPLAWMALVICWIGAGASYLGASKRAKLLEESKGLDSIAALSWREFEMLVGEAFRRRGYDVEELGGRGSDGGIDLILRRTGKVELVQCKQWRTRQIKVNVVREMWGLAQHHHAASVRIVCIGEFTRDAAAFAADKPIELINGAALVALIDEARGSASSSTRPLRPLQADLPSCPRCTAPMQSRRNRRTGETFWGCTHYPQCNGTRPGAPA